MKIMENNRNRKLEWNTWRVQMWRRSDGGGVRRLRVDDQQSGGRGTRVNVSQQGDARHVDYRQRRLGNWSSDAELQLHAGLFWCEP